MLTLKGTSPVAVLAETVCPAGIKPLLHASAGAPVGAPNVFHIDAANSSKVSNKNFYKW